MLLFSKEYDSNKLIDLQTDVDKCIEIRNFNREMLRIDVEMNIDYYTNHDVDEEMLEFFKNHDVVTIIHQDSERDVYICIDK